MVMASNSQVLGCAELCSQGNVRSRADIGERRAQLGQDAIDERICPRPGGASQRRDRHVESLGTANCRGAEPPLAARHAGHIGESAGVADDGVAGGYRIPCVQFTQDADRND